jgi:hypothetical protein
MVELNKITKAQTIEAANHFLDGFARWADCFFDDTAGARLLNLPESEYITGSDYFDPEAEEKIKSNRSKTDFSQFTFVIQIETIYEFAMTGHWFGDSLDASFEFDDVSTPKMAYLNHLSNVTHRRIDLNDVLTEFASFLHVFESRPWLSWKDGGTDFLGGDTLEILSTIVHAAMARHNLREGASILTLDEIALLAGVSIKTIRNAVSSKGHDRLVLAGGKHDNPVVHANEAYRWLLTKKGFTGPFLYDEEPPYEAYETLAQFRHHCFVLRMLSKLEIPNIAEALQWDKHLTDAYTKLENLEVTPSLELLTPAVLLKLSRIYKSKSANTFVIEGSRILASIVAELRAKELFI